MPSCTTLVVTLLVVSAQIDLESSSTLLHHDAPVDIMHSAGHGLSRVPSSKGAQSGY